MKIEITNKISLDNLPSASGLEIINENLYIVGDDSPFLYLLDFNFKQIDRIQLFSTNDFSNGRMPKHLKPDLEFLTKLEIENKKYLFTGGSGSAKGRDKGFLIELNSYKVTEVSLSGIYNSLKNNQKITGNLVLNIEGLAATQNQMLFFNRSNNTIIIYNETSFLSFIRGLTDINP